MRDAFSQATGRADAVMQSLSGTPGNLTVGVDSPPSIPLQMAAISQHDALFHGRCRAA